MSNPLKPILDKLTDLDSRLVRLEQAVYHELGLTPDQISIIRTSHEPIHRLAVRYNLSKQQIHNIKYRGS
jgi:hypothetical protein